MFLRKKAQSTAEYAITLGLVVAVAAGVLQTALKGGIRQKNAEALNYLKDSGSELLTTGTEVGPIYNQQARKTTVLGGTDNFVDKKVMSQGGKEEVYQKQTTQSSSTDVELLTEVPQGE